MGTATKSRKKSARPKKVKLPLTSSDPEYVPQFTGDKYELLMIDEGGGDIRRTKVTGVSLEEINRVIREYRRIFPFGHLQNQELVVPMFDDGTSQFPDALFEDGFIWGTGVQQ